MARRRGDTVSDFGDFDPDDALDTEPADPEQVARRLHALRRRDGFETIDWDDLDDGERGALVQIVAALLGWLRRQGALR
jgi:hypothetical protein